MITKKRGAAVLGVSTLGVALAVITVGCDDKKTDEASKPPAGETAGDKKEAMKADSVEEKAKALEGQVKNASFPAEVSKDKENAAALVHLATTSENPEVQVASLRAMKSLFTTSDKDDKRVLVDDGYRAAVLKGLDSKDGKVQKEAFSASQLVVGGNQPDPKITEKLIDLAKGHPSVAGRMEAFSALRSHQNRHNSEAAMGAWLEALDAEEAALVSMALWTAPTNPKNPEPLWNKAKELLQHADAGVRGRAAQLLGKMVGGDEAKAKEVSEALTPLLSDENAFTKSAAADGLATTNHPAAVHAIVKLLDDTASNTYDIKDYEELDGRAGWLHHDGSAWSTVQDAALYALKRLSGKTKERFDYKVEAKTKDDDLKRSAEEAKAWYGKVKAEIPAFGVAAP
jgi:HEAT repeat protein